MSPDPRRAVVTTLDTREWFVTYDASLIYGSQWKMRLIVETVVNYGFIIPQVRT